MELTVICLFAYKDRPYSLHKIVNLFILVFLVIANTIQCVNHSIVSPVYKFLTEVDYIEFQLLIFVIVLVYNFIYPIFKFKNISCAIKTPPLLSHEKLILLSLFSFFMVLFSNRENLPSLFFRGINEVLYIPNESDTNVAGSMLFSSIFRTMPFACYIMAVNYNIKRKYCRILLLIMIIDLFPTGISRNQLATYYLPVLLINSKLLQKRNLFVLLMIFGLFVIFPLMNNFRYFMGDDDLVIEYSLDFLDSMHLDASQEFMIVMKDNMITYGRQLLGVVFFWVPRAIWLTKPEGSGFLLANKYGVFPNISMPYFAEGYVNFGLIGIFIFTIVLAYISSRFDSIFWDSKNCFLKKQLTPYYLTILGGLMLVMRGELMSSTAYMLGSLVDIYMVYVISHKTINKKSLIIL